MNLLKVGTCMLAVAMIGASVGCGGDDENGGDSASDTSAAAEEEVRETLSEFAAAVKEDDPDCTDYVLSDGPVAERMEIYGSSGEPGCTFIDEEIGENQVADVTVTGDEAEVRFEGVGGVKFVRSGDEWLIESVE